MNRKPILPKTKPGERKPRQAKEKECPGCGSKVKRFSGNGVCGKCLKNDDVMSRVQLPEPKAPREHTAVTGYYTREGGYIVEVTQVFNDDDEAVVEFKTPQGRLLYKTASDFLKDYERNR